jgi:hypothetical protein
VAGPERGGRAIERDPDLHAIDITVTHCVIACGAAEALRGNWVQAEVHLERTRVARETARYHQANSTARLANASHYLQEDAPEALAAAVERVAGREGE